MDKDKPDFSHSTPLENDDIEQIVAVVRSEFNRQAGFGCRPSVQDYTVSLKRWFSNGVMPSDNESPT